MMRLRSRRAYVLAGVVLVVAAIGVGVAVAASTVVRDTTNVRLRVIQSEFANGFDSGWHMHPGPVIVHVQRGYFKIYQGLPGVEGTCEPTVVRKGETYLEAPFVPIRAVAKGEIQWTTSQILPASDSPATPVDNPCD
jgi:hypothetical protein